MSFLEILLLFAPAFAGAVMSHLETSRKYGWSVGEMFSGAVPVFVYLSVMALNLGLAAGSAYYDKLSWWWLLWVVVASFTGAAFIPFILKSWSGIVSMIFSITLTLLAVAVNFWR